MKATLHIWPDDGGTSVYWAYPKRAAFKDFSFFHFGKFSGGWFPFGLRTPKKWAREAKQAAQKRGYEVTIKFQTPEEANGHSP